MQRELVSLTRGKPTFQWIEAGPMEHCRENQDPTPAVVRAETWLAIAGGARGIGYFPDWWEETIRGEVRLTNREILALAPALLSPVAKANWSTDGPVRIGARRYNGATYVIAVNTSTAMTYVAPLAPRADTDGPSVGTSSPWRRGGGAQRQGQGSGGSQAHFRRGSSPPTSPGKSGSHAPRPAIASQVSRADDGRRGYEGSQRQCSIRPQRGRSASRASARRAHVAVHKRCSICASEQRPSTG